MSEFLLGVGGVGMQRLWLHLLLYAIKTYFLSHYCFSLIPFDRSDLIYIQVKFQIWHVSSMH